MEAIDLSKLKALPGRAAPLGPCICRNGVRFSIFSRHARRLWLALFNDEADVEPACEFEFDSVAHKTGDLWSMFIDGLKPGALYAYRVETPRVLRTGRPLRLTRQILSSPPYLLDPYARVIVGDVDSGTAKCLVADIDQDWASDTRPRTPMNETIIYETHIRGLTAHPSSGAAPGGTYLAFMEKIPYLKDLGITAVELMPVQERGQNVIKRVNPLTGEILENYWGYNPIGFFAPAGRYASQGGKGEQLDEFRKLVTALHKAGMEVILDIVFNHTAEDGEQGSTLSLRGIDDSIYYMVDKNGEYIDFSGCGNTVNCNHPIVRDLILECLRYWVTTFHIDGFRFDLATILARDVEGNLLSRAPLIESISEDPVLRDVKLIAEAWDMRARQVGSFGNVRWAEWNDRYRDDVRRFWLGGENFKGEFASRLAGSSDIYQRSGRGPMHSINYITAHDGFTLRDLVSYNEKHNEANGEENRDGPAFNYSWNCGEEGENDDPELNALRMRMQKNLLASLFLSLGVPMLLGGDEFGRTQKGNNNAYCQDNDVSWYDWTLVEKNRELHRFCRELIRFRKENPVFSRPNYFIGQPREGQTAKDVIWLGPEGKPETWDEAEEALACWINGSENHLAAIYMAFNPLETSRSFVPPRGRWAVRIDTAATTPNDITLEADAKPVRIGATLTIAPRSLMVLVARATSTP